MKITLSQYAGFCDGVKRAYEIVMGSDVSSLKKPVYVLGSLVHNDEVNRKIEAKGIGKIDRETFFASKPGEIGTLIITAHGVGPDIYETAKTKNITLIDTTCPKVIKVQRLAKLFFEKGYKIILIGDRDHKEVRGIDEWGGAQSFIVSQKEDLDNLKFSQNDKIAVLSQTTQNEDFCLEIAKLVRKKYKNAEVISTTCNTTHSRQGEIKDLAKNHEAVLVIGSKTSANSNRLFEIASEVNPRSYFIENVSEIDSRWFLGINSIGITAGASTPDWVIEKIVEYLKNRK